MVSISSTLTPSSQISPRADAMLLTEDGPVSSIENNRTHNEVMQVKKDLFSLLPLELQVAILSQEILSWKNRLEFSVASKVCKMVFDSTLCAILKPIGVNGTDIVQFLGTVEVTNYLRNGRDHNSPSSISTSFALHWPFRVLVDYALEGRYKHVPFDAMKLMISTTNEQEDISIQTLIDIRLIDLSDLEKEKRSDASTSTTAEGPAESIQPSTYLFKEQWSFIRKNMAELFLLAQTQQFKILAFLKSPREALEEGIVGAFLREDCDEVVELMLENPIFCILHKNVLYPRQHPIPKLLQDMTQDNIASKERWLEKYIQAGMRIEDEAQDSVKEPFLSVIENGYINIVKLLIQSGIKPNWLYDDGQTPISYAVGVGNLVIVQLLLEAGADPFPQNQLRWNIPLVIAIPKHAVSEQPSSLEIIQALLSKIKDVNRKDKDGYTLLTIAIEEEWALPIIEFLLARGADPHPQDQPHWKSPLVRAIEKEHPLEILEALLNKIEDINQKDEYGYTLLHRAIEEKCALSIIKPLLARGADPFPRDQPYLETPLAKAIREERPLEIIEALLNKIEDINQKDKDGYTLLHRAIEEKWALPIIKPLLARGADPFPRDQPYSETPLAKAIREERPLEIIEALLNKIEDINQKDKDGYTLLHGAIEEKWALPIIKPLFARGADPFPRDQPYSKTPLAKAIREKRPLEIIEALLNKIEDVNQKDEDGYTLLHRAIEREWALSIVKSLLARGADPLPQDQPHWKTPLAMAIQKKRPLKRIEMLVGNIQYINQKDNTSHWLLQFMVREKYSLKTIESLFKKGGHFPFSLRNLFVLRNMRKSENLDKEVFELLKTKASEGRFGFTWLRKAFIFCFCL